jgi:hypothetical protein
MTVGPHAEIAPVCNWPDCTNPARGLCRGHQKALAQLLDQLATDYLTIRATMPKPTGKGRTAPRGSRTYGHPAAAASDTCAQIADTLDGASESVRDHLGHLPPPPRRRAENRVMAHAHKTLTARLDTLGNFPGATDTIQEMRDARKAAGKLLGIGSNRIAIRTACPDCGIVPVFRVVGFDRTDRIMCDADGCEWVVNSDHYGLYLRMVIDDWIDKSDEAI